MIQIFQVPQMTYSFTNLIENVNVDRVNIVETPKFNVKVNNTMITMVLDTGATGSMVSLELVELLNLHVYPSSHSAMLADGDSQLHVDSNG